jgi:ribonuclease HII
MPKLYLSGKTIICGCDEAGRGCLAGPVVAAAVILPDNYFHPKLNDSKQISAADRNLLADHIRQHAIAYAIGMVDHQGIDQTNIHKASYLAMHLAIDQLSIRPERIIVDGNHFIPYKKIPHECHVKGDTKFSQIAAASILAKTHRDELMMKLHLLHPEYGWNTNKGYPTTDHRDAIRQYGPSPYHRMSFRLLKDQSPGLFDELTA